MRDYKENIAELKENGIKPKFGDFYDFEGFPLADEFKEYYNFCQEYLDRNDLEYKISPASFFTKRI